MSKDQNCPIGLNTQSRITWPWLNWSYSLSQSSSQTLPRSCEVGHISSFTILTRKASISKDLLKRIKVNSNDWVNWGQITYDMPVSDDFKQVPEDGLRKWASFAVACSCPICADVFTPEAMNEDCFQCTAELVGLSVLAGHRVICCHIALLQRLQCLCYLFLDPLQRRWNKKKRQVIPYFLKTIYTCVMKPKHSNTGHLRKGKTMLTQALLFCWHCFVNMW